MSDTGAPWNLPYPLPTDLVRDGAQAIQDLAEATADGLDDAGNAGIGSNVVQTVKTDTFTTTSLTAVNITGLQVTITPSSATAKVLLIAQLHFSAGAADTFPSILISGGNAGTYIGDASASIVRVATGQPGSGSTGRRDAQRIDLHASTVVLLDNPATSSPVTYNVTLSGAGGTVAINRNDDDTMRAASSFTAIEVAA